MKQWHTLYVFLYNFEKHLLNDELLLALMFSVSHFYTLSYIYFRSMFQIIGFREVMFVSVLPIVPVVRTEDGL